MDFLTAAAIGRFVDIDAALEKEIAAWHVLAAAVPAPALHVYLGMTAEQYASWIEQRVTAQQLVAEHCSTLDPAWLEQARALFRPRHV